MSRTIPAPLVSHLALGTTTLAGAIRIERTDAEVFGFTSHDIEVTISGVLYRPDPGLTLKDVSVSSGGEVGNLEITALHDGSFFTTTDLFSGIWTNAKFYIFRYNFESPADGVIPVLAGRFGELRVMQSTVMVELHDLRRFLSHGVGAASSKNCRYRFGSQTRPTGGLCMVDTGPITVTGTLTGVTSNQVFRDSSRADADDYFGGGEFEFTSGPNAGIRALIKDYDGVTAPGTFTLALPLWSTVAIGHTYQAIPGCRKRFAEDCRDKWSNELNFGGEPHRKGINDVTAPPTLDLNDIQILG